MTGLMRPLDIRYNSNLAAVGLAILGFLAGMALSVGTEDIGTAFADGIALGVTIFLAWAIGRELHPDRHGLAIFAALVGGGLWLVVQASALAAALLTLVTIRILVRSTGRPPTTIDVLVLIGLAVWGGRTAPGWIAGLGLAYALARDVRLPDPAGSRQLFAAFAVAAAATIGAFVGAASFASSWTWFAVAVVAAGIIAGLLTSTREPTTLTDDGAGVISRERLVTARRAAVVIAVFGALTGEAGVAALAPLWAGILALPIIEFLPARGTALLEERVTPQTPSDPWSGAPAAPSAEASPD